MVPNILYIVIRYGCVEEATYVLVISSSERLKPHWLKSSHANGNIKAYCFFYVPTGANMNVNNAFFTSYCTADSYA